MKIITNTAISLDGKISRVKNELMFLGSTEDRRRMSLIRAQADAILVGGNSFRNWPKPLLPRPEHRSRDLSITPILNVVVSHGAGLTFDENYLNEPCIRPLILTDAAGSEQDFPVEVIRRVGGLTAQWIAGELGRRGVKTLLIEAGGELIAQFLEADLINEMYVTLCPKIIGGTESPMFIVGRQFGEKRIQELKLLESETVGNEIFLHYGVK